MPSSKDYKTDDEKLELINQKQKSFSGEELY